MGKPGIPENIFEKFSKFSDNEHFENIFGWKDVS